MHEVARGATTGVHLAVVAYRPTHDDMTLKQFTRKEVEGHNLPDDAMFIIDNVVYDVTNFLEDHPGGFEVLLENAGKDASKCFRDIGHTEDAYEWRKQFVAGEVVAEDRWEVIKRKSEDGSEDPLSVGGLLHVWGPPLTLAVASIFLYMYLF